MVGQFIARVAGLAALVAGSQAPGFALQYTQNLTGRVDELATIVENYDAIVEDLDTTREGYVDDLRAAERESTDRTAIVIEDTYERYEFLASHLADIQAAAPLQKPLVVAREIQQDIAESTMETFKPAVPLTVDGFVYALGAAIVVWGALAAFFGLIASMFGMGDRRYA
ncbi:MAG: DUF2937 family protein [Pseudomonadota bacterium]